jgi:hypothetical protein
MPGSGASGVSMGRLRQDGRSAVFVRLWVCWLLCGLTMGGAMRLASKHKDHTALAKQRYAAVGGREWTPWRARSQAMKLATQATGTH